MPSVWVREPHRKGGNWRVYWRIGGRGSPRYSRNCGPLKTYAEEFAAKKRLELHAGSLGIEGPKRPLLWPDFSREYLAYSGAHKAVNTVRHFDEPAIASFAEIIQPAAVQGVTHRDVERWKMALLKRLSPNTVRMRLRHLRSAFGYARRLGYITTSPAAAVPMPSEVDVARVLRREEIGCLLGAVSQIAARACILALHTGMRRGEVLALDWSWVHRPEESPWEIHIPKEITKSNEDRVVLLHPSARAALGAEGKGKVLVGLTIDVIELNLKKAAAALKLKRIRFHDLRHTWATEYMTTTGDLAGLMAQGGWRSLTAVKRYQHLTHRRLEANLALDFGIGATQVLPNRPGKATATRRKE